MQKSPVSSISYLFELSDHTTLINMIREGSSHTIDSHHTLLIAKREDLWDNFHCFLPSPVCYHVLDSLALFSILMSYNRASAKVQTLSPLNVSDSNSLWQTTPRHFLSCFINSKLRRQTTPRSLLPCFINSCGIDKNDFHSECSKEFTTENFHPDNLLCCPDMTFTFHVYIL